MSGVFVLQKGSERVTNKQEAFCEEFLKNGQNATQAYMTIYNTTESTAKASASRLLTDVNIQKYIDERKKEIKKDNIASVEEVCQFLTETIKNADERTSDRLKASELLGKYHGMFTEKQKVDLNGNITIVDDVNE